MKLKKILCVLLALVMVMSIVTMTISAAEDCTVVDNIIDITDKTIYEKSILGSAKVVNIKIMDADVESATEDNTTINIVLDSNTSPDATINIEFGTALDRNMNISGHKANVTLSEGSASVSMTIKGQYSSASSWSNTVTYLLNFSLDEASTTPPVRIVESDSKSTYSGVAIDLNLRDYFEDAKEYYLIEGDKKTLVDGKTYSFKNVYCYS